MSACGARHRIAGRDTRHPYPKSCMTQSRAWDASDPRHLGWTWHANRTQARRLTHGTGRPVRAPATTARPSSRDRRDHPRQLGGQGLHGRESAVSGRHHLQRHTGRVALPGCETGVPLTEGRWPGPGVPPAREVAPLPPQIAITRRRPDRRPLRHHSLAVARPAIPPRLVSAACGQRRRRLSPVPADTVHGR